MSTICYIQPFVICICTYQGEGGFLSRSRNAIMF